MILIRTPFRISFFGGGSDYPIWFKKHGGQVLSTSINKYCYITVRKLPPFFNHKYRIRYTRREETNMISEIEHPSVRACLDFMQVEHGVEILHTSDIPANSGVGSSSAFTVGLLYALYSLQGRIPAKRRLAKEAIYIEQTIIGENVGSQDQIACCFGGLNKIEFKKNSEFVVTPLPVNVLRLEKLRKRLLLFFTGVSRFSSDIAGDKINNLLKREKHINDMKVMVDIAIKVLNGEEELITFGNLLDESWKRKKELSDRVSTKEIDDIYESVRRYIIGGKILGSGGGGFLLFFAEPEHHTTIKKILKKLVYVPFDFDNTGTQLIYYSK